MLLGVFCNIISKLSITNPSKLYVNLNTQKIANLRKEKVGVYIIGLIFVLIVSGIFYLANFCSLFQLFNRPYILLFLPSLLRYCPFHLHNNFNICTLIFLYFEVLACIPLYSLKSNWKFSKDHTLYIYV